jgi:hypothetical protein
MIFAIRLWLYKFHSLKGNFCPSDRDLALGILIDGNQHANRDPVGPTLKRHLKEFAMKKVLAFAALILIFCSPILGQTLSLNDGSILQSSTNRIGMNIGAIDYWDTGQVLKNLIGSINPGFEPLLAQQIWVVGAAGTSTTFVVPDTWDGVPANYWAGGTFNVVASQSGGAEMGCTGTIASNTGPNYPTNGGTVSPVVTVSTPCAGAFSVGDIVIMSKSTFPTPETWWENSEGGFWGGVSGGGQLLSDTTDLCATCGTQSLNMNATAAGSSATAGWYFDSSPSIDMFVLMNGTYQISFWAKLASGTPVLTINAYRPSTGGFNCGTYTPKLTSSWAQYKLTCTASETTSTVPQSVQLTFQTAGGSIYLDNVSFEKTSSDPSNTTVFRDEVIDTLKNYYQTSTGGNPGMFRDWLSQNGETVDNWTQPDYAHAPTSTGTQYFAGPIGGGGVGLPLEDYLAIAQVLNAEPYLEVPVTISTSDAANLIEFLAGSSSTTYGARRAALGQSAPWTSVFNKIHLSFCNECWNGTPFVGQSLGYRTGTPNAPNLGPEFYYDYSIRAKPVFAAMRASSSYSASAFDLVMNAQTAINYTMDTAIQRAQPDSIEIEGYTYSTVSSFGSDAALWGPAMVEPYERVANPNDATIFYTSVHDYQSLNTCGASGTTACKVNVYEWGQGTQAGSLDQTHMDYINAGAGEGVVMALQPLLLMQYYGILDQSFFSLAEYQNGSYIGSAPTSKLWGNVVDMGGATNNVRPHFLAISLVNQSIIGPMYSCPITNNLTYNFAANASNGSPTMPAINNVPYLYAFCFENGAQRSIVLINTDLSNSHAVSFSGTNPPAGTVIERQYAPSSLDDMNEAHSGTATNQTQATVVLDSSSLSNPASVTLPPYSVTALDFTANVSPAATPVITPGTGTYTSVQTVTITDSTAGATIYYTTNGKSPTTSSTVFNANSPITVGANETIQAIAVANGSAISAIATATYTVSLPVTSTPTFTPAAGTYSTAQTVTISDSTTGATIYYTTDGSTPTTASTVFNPAKPITVTSSETIHAIAVVSGNANSAVATAAYTMNTTTTAAATPTFSPVAGTYSTAQTVTISDSTTGATIYYTTDGSTPTTASTVFNPAKPITVSTNETINAIAAASGDSNSTVATAKYVINTQVTTAAATPTFSLAGGTYTGAQSVTLSDTTANATIYYTLNGSAPTTSSTLYSGTITVSASETIEAVAVAPNYATSATATAAYTINAATSGVVDFSISVSPTALSVLPGQNGNTVLTVTPLNGFSSPITFTCPSLPAGSACTFTPATVTPSGANASTIVTVAPISTSTAASNKSNSLLPGATLAVAFCFLSWKRRRFLYTVSVLALSIYGLSVFTGCSAVTMSTVSSSVSVTATSGSLQHTATFSYTVQ